VAEHVEFRPEFKREENLNAADMEGQVLPERSEAQTAEVLEAVTF
jgi:hypothetical protein